MRYPLRLSCSPVLALLALLVALSPARGVVRDGGIDPANLGKGEWLYYMSSATNGLGGYVSSVTNENSLMLYLKSQGTRYVIIKAATSNFLFKGDYTVPQFTSNLVQIAHANGLLVFGYNRSYGGDIPGEIRVSDYVFKEGADGFVWDAEAEWESNKAWISTNGPALAWQLCSAVRSNWPTKFLAHAPMPIIAGHTSFPYKEFGYWSDAVMPQIYHFNPVYSPGFTNSVSQAINWSDANWTYYQNQWAGMAPTNINGLTVYWTNAIKPSAPIQDVYGPPFSPATPDKDVQEFMDYLAADPQPQVAGGYQGVSFFRADLHDTAQWAYIKTGTLGSVPGIINSIVLDNPSAQTGGSGGSWTSVQTFSFTGALPSRNVFEGNGSLTDTNSFGTNYLTRGQGSGTAWVEFTPRIVVPGDYAVYQWHPWVTNASASVPHMITYNGGTTNIYANQQTNNGNWSLLGRFNFAAGTSGTIRVSDAIPESGGLAIADGIKLVFVASNAPYAGPVSAWGDNSWGQLEVPALTNVFAVAAGAYHNLALLWDGTVAAWGDDWSGQCAVPEGLSNVAAIAAGGYHSLALRRDGSVVAWGDNDYGQTNMPAGLRQVIAIAAGAYHSLALRRDGSVVAWGDNSAGQCSVPADLGRVTALAAGGNHSLAVIAGGTVAAWGENTDGSGRFVGQSIVPLHLGNVAGVGAGFYHSLAVKGDGSVAAWGDNSSGQCAVPAGLNGVVAVAGGRRHSLALRSDGTVVAWGANGSGQCSSPALSDAAGLGAGAFHSLALAAGNLPAPWLFSPAWEDNQFSALVQSTYRKSYVLEGKSSLAASTWSAVATNSGNDGLVVLSDPSASGRQRFYRVQRQ